MNSETSTSTAVASEERREARHVIVNNLRACLNRVLATMYVRVGGYERTLALAPEPKCATTRSVAEVAQLFSNGLIDRKEARALAGEMFGRQFD